MHSRLAGTSSSKGEGSGTHITMVLAGLALGTTESRSCRECWEKTSNLADPSRRFTEET